MRHLLLHNERGETLIEVLASILIAALSVALLFTCVMASSRMEQSAQKKDAAHYGAFTNADTQSSPALSGGTVTFSWIKPADEDDLTPIPEATATPPIEFYGGEGMFSYKR